MRSPVIRWISAAAGLALGLTPLTGCNRHSVTYEVTGNAHFVNIDYSNTNDAMARVIDQALPWSYEFQCGEAVRYLCVSAYTEYHGGTLKVSIAVDGKTLQAKSSTDDPPSATAEMMWP